MREIDRSIATMLKELGVLVVNLATLEERIYSSNLTPEQAVIAAHA